MDQSNDTMLAGLYALKYRGVLVRSTPKPHMNCIDEAGTCDVYDLSPQETLRDLAGRMFIDCGPGGQAFVHPVEKQDKPIAELRTVFGEQALPGYLKFIQPLSKVERLPNPWVTALKSSREVYLLTCPRGIVVRGGIARFEGARAS